jgi:hypothetical protein
VLYNFYFDRLTFDSTYGIHLTNTVAYKRRTPGWWNNRGFRSGCRHTLLQLTMEKERAKTDVKVKLDIRIPPEVAKWLLWLLMSGGAVTAAAHWI